MLKKPLYFARKYLKIAIYVKSTSTHVPTIPFVSIMMTNGSNACAKTDISSEGRWGITLPSICSNKKIWMSHCKSCFALLHVTNCQLFHLLNSKSERIVLYLKVLH